jgi:organic hydroperoxide reductase OsmC/OhrA
MDALYVASATSWGGRSGRAASSDGALDVAIAVPKELGGDGEGTNPEQLMAAGYACCFLNALILVAAKREIDPARRTVTADVGLVTISGGLGSPWSCTSASRDRARDGREAGGAGAPRLPVLQRDARQRRPGADDRGAGRRPGLSRSSDGSVV